MACCFVPCQRLEPDHQRVAFAIISEAGDRQLLHAVLIGEASEFEDDE